MKYLAFSPDKKYRLEIEEDETIGFYLIIYPNGNSASIADYVQDSLAIVKEQAYELYQVDPNSWIRIG
jgi:hypothetical protein